jgi:hypothetical protein
MQDLAYQLRRAEYLHPIILRCGYDLPMPGDLHWKATARYQGADRAKHYLIQFLQRFHSDL